MNCSLIPGTIFNNGSEGRTVSSGSIRSLFAPGFVRDTIGLWLAFFACLNGIYLVFGWLPSMLSARGIDVATASSGLAAYNFGGVLGVLVCALIVTLVGSRRPLLWMAAAGSVSAFGVAVRSHRADRGAHSVDRRNRSTRALRKRRADDDVRSGVPCLSDANPRYRCCVRLAAVGRVGGILSSLAGAAIIQAGNGGVYLAVLVVAMGVTFVGLAIVRNHYPGRRGSG